MVSSTTKTGKVPGPLAMALDALQKIAEDAATECAACRGLRATVAAGHMVDERVEHDRARCPGAHAWPALARIARGGF